MPKITNYVRTNLRSSNQQALYSLPLNIFPLLSDTVQSSSSLAVPSLPVMVNSSSGTVNSVGVVSLSTAAVPTDTAAAPQPTVVNSHVSPGGGGGGSGGGGGGTQPQLTTESQVRPPRGGVFVLRRLSQDLLHPDLNAWQICYRRICRH